MASAEEIRDAKIRIAAGTATERDNEVARQTISQMGKDRNEMLEAIEQGKKEAKHPKRLFG